MATKSDIKLSILIPTVSSRESALNRMLSSIQASHTDDVEVVVLHDDFKYSIGAKRNALLAAAYGKWSTFVDDDDVVSPNYCTAILNAIRRNPGIDQVGYKLKMYQNGVYKNIPTYHSLTRCDRREWYSTKRGYFRPTTHLNPMRIEIARSIPFPDVSRGEDHDWAMRILSSGQIKKEFYIDQFLYFYYANTEYSASINKGQAKRLVYPTKSIVMPVRYISL